VGHYLAEKGVFTESVVENAALALQTLLWWLTAGVCVEAVKPLFLQAPDSAGRAPLT